jgi:predicted dehydrogenase
MNVSEASYRAGIVGCGFIGAADQVSGTAIGQQVEALDGTHFSALSGHPRIDLVAGSSRDEGRRDRFKERAGARVYADWKEMVEKENLDIVSVATYAPSHAEITIGSAERGARAIYCEKPIANRVSDADHMLSTCEKNNTLLVINHNRRYNPNGDLTRERIAGGDLGDLTSVTLQWPTGRTGGVGTHIIDAMCMYLGQRVAAVSGTLDFAGKPDCRGPDFKDYGSCGVLRMQSGLLVTVDAVDFSVLPVQIAINGTQGRAITAGDDVEFEYWDGRRDRLPSQKGEQSSMDRAVSAMVAALEGDSEFPYPAIESINVLEAIVGFHLSHDRNGAWVELPLSGTDREREVMCA